MAANTMGEKRQSRDTGLKKQTIKRRTIAKITKKGEKKNGNMLNINHNRHKNDGNSNKSN